MEDVGEYLITKVIPSNRPAFAFNSLYSLHIYCFISKAEVYGVLCHIYSLTKNKLKVESKLM